MKFVHKTLGLLLASLALGSCGGGGGDGHGAFEPPQSGHITLTPAGNSTRSAAECRRVESMVAGVALYERSRHPLDERGWDACFRP